jgi:hypothetical protein
MAWHSFSRSQVMRFTNEFCYYSFNSIEHLYYV